jgi:NOL1/NOP2/fmu family ribosome biogenesis protein
MDVWTSLKKGGVMIYSTCTFNPGENEENVKWLADKTGASSISLDISRFDGIKEISYGGITGYGFYPGMIKGEGFFLSVLQKKHGGSDFKPGFRKRKTGTLLKDGLNKAEMLIGKFPERLFRQDDFVWLSALPVDEYRYLGKYLRIIKGGVRLFKMKGPVFIPAHDLALSVVLSDNTFPVCELDYNDSLAFLRRDPIRSQVMPEGWIIASYRGVRLGFMKNVRSRINNYYPVDWRIRKDFGSAGQMEIIRWDG